MYRIYTHSLRAMLAIYLLAFPQQSFSQAELPDPGHCRIVVVPYVWTVNTTGDHTIGLIKRSVEISFGDIFGELKLAAAAYFEVNKNQWFGGVGLAYLNYGTDSDSGLILGNRFKNFKED